MSRKMDFIPLICDYEWIRNQMYEDLKYRLESRHSQTSLGRPLYYRINTQIIITQECPYHCPFCIERKNPMEGKNDFEKQIVALKQVLSEHPAARLTITGGEPGLYPHHVKNLVDTYFANGDKTFVSINTSGYSTELNGLAHINLSVNDYVKPDTKKFPVCTLQTVLKDGDMTLNNLRKIMMENPNVDAFSFRYLSFLEKHDYSVRVFNEMQWSDDFQVSTFRVGDFFVYVTFNWFYNGKKKHGRITLGDMYQQQHNDYQDGYSNIIIHPNGEVRINWK